MRGAKRKPSAVLRLEGSSQFRKPHRQNTEPDAPDGDPGCPPWLDREGKAEWRRVTASLRAMGILKTTDRTMLAALCQAESELVRYSAALNKLKPAFIGTMKSRRLQTMVSDATKRAASICACFGLDPSNRSRIHVEPGDTGASDEYGEFLDQRKA